MMAAVYKHHEAGGSERGSAMIEAALVFSMLLTIMMGLVALGRDLLAYHFVSYAAREATRYAEVHGSDSRSPATPESIEAFVKRLAMGVDPSSIHVITEWKPDNAPGSVVRVQVKASGLAAASEVTVLH